MSDTDPALYPHLAVLGEGQSHNAVPEGNAIPHQVARALTRGAGAPVPAFVPGIGGTSWTTLATTLPARVLPYVAACARPIVLLNGGTQDLLDGDTGAAVYAEMVAHAVRIRRNAPANALIIGCTIPGINAIINPTWSAPREAARVAANALIVGNADGAWNAAADIASAVNPLDVESVPLLEDGDYYFDGVHLTPQGAGKATDQVLPAIAVADPTIPIG